MKTVKISELNIEVETRIHNKNESLRDIEIPEGWRLLRVEEIVFLFNHYKKELNMSDTWEFFEQPLNLNKQYNYTAGLVAASDWADLDCGGHPVGSDSSLGVRFCKDLNKEHIISYLTNNERNKRKTDKK